VLAELAGDRPAFELGIGTGRIALPLRERGVEVHGVDLSAAMLARLRAKPGGDQIPSHQGDFATIRLTERFGLVYLVFNTIMNLTSQDEQVSCFRTAADHLLPGGYFVVEVMLPDLQRLPAGERFRPFTVTADHLGIDEYDVVGQGLVSHHYTREPDGLLRQRSIPFRYVWPSELDLMARLAGMRPHARWADWRRSPFTADSTGHVSIWQLGQG